MNENSYAWMIERRSDVTNNSSQPLWWDGDRFSPDPNEGVRFARRTDAERVIAAVGMLFATATDHEWVGESPVAGLRRPAKKGAQ